MSTAVATIGRRYTPEDLLSMPDGKSYELVDGRLVERRMGAESSDVGGTPISISPFLPGARLGDRLAGRQRLPVLPSCPRHGPQTGRLVHQEGPVAGRRLPKGWVKIPPDLAVEVISPNDSAEDLEEKLEDYQKAGVPLVWVIYPERRMARVFRQGSPPVVLGEDDELSGEDVIPGFRCPLREILPRLEPIEGPRARPGRRRPGLIDPGAIYFDDIPSRSCSA